MNIKTKYTKYSLTGREVEVLLLVLKNMSNKQIANVLCIHEDTVKAHMKSILFKMQVPDRLGIFAKIFDIPLTNYINKLEMILQSIE